jgi:hypothetical protein
MGMVDHILRKLTCQENVEVKASERNRMELSKLIKKVIKGWCYDKEV